MLRKAFETQIIDDGADLIGPWRRPRQMLAEQVYDDHVSIHDDTTAQRLGFKAFGGQLVPGGTIIVRQRGTRVKPGLNVGRGKDDTLFAKITGRIKFLNKGSMGKFVMVEPVEAK